MCVCICILCECMCTNQLWYSTFGVAHGDDRLRGDLFQVVIFASRDVDQTESQRHCDPLEDWCVGCVFIYCIFVVILSVLSNFNCLFDAMGWILFVIELHLFNLHQIQRFII